MFLLWNCQWPPCISFPCSLLAFFHSCNAFHFQHITKSTPAGEFHIISNNGLHSNPNFDRMAISPVLHLLHSPSLLTLCTSQFLALMTLTLTPAGNLFYIINNNGLHGNPNFHKMATSRLLSSSSWHLASSNFSPLSFNPESS